MVLFLIVYHFFISSIESHDCYSYRATVQCIVLRMCFVFMGLMCLSIGDILALHFQKHFFIITSSSQDFHDSDENPESLHPMVCG